MRTVEVHVDIARPAEEVFAFVADHENNPRWQRGMRTCRWTSDDPPGVGSTYEQEARFLGRPVRSTFRVSEYEPPRRIRIETVSGTFPIDVTRTISPLGPDECRVSAEIGGGPTGRLARFAEPVLRTIVRRSVERDYRRLEVLLEADQPGA
ncbi:MAG: SRPBCC family protein [Actinomycetota bacterium]|nr:SRPBCC family protein [Actinomycetota bacterium]